MVDPPPVRTYSIPLPHGGVLTLGERPLLMGIVNVTPDSFSDGGAHRTADQAVAHGTRLVEAGADLLDVGGESTRPGAQEIPADEQIRRVVGVIAGLAARFPATPLSVDTRSAAVARAAVQAGADVVNDVSGLSHDPAMAPTVSELGAPAVVMHMRGSPADMRQRAEYEDVVEDVVRELRESLDRARAAGIVYLLADPGIGFAKTAEQSLRLLAQLPRLATLDVPVLVGPSRKSFLDPFTTEVEGACPAEFRRDATVAATALCAWSGAHVIRVHDVRACIDGVRLAWALREAAAGGGRKENRLRGGSSTRW